ncbi:MAG: phosphopantetheine-binding protein [Planctomycetia bacterium]|nr:phosphopantetheine-binding protein [Planctomycetia bacterium]
MPRANRARNRGTMMTPIEIEDRVRQFVLATFLVDTPPEAFQNSDDLFLLLDSLQILRLVIHLESTFGVKVQQQELTADNLSSVQKVAAFMVRKIGDRRLARVAK